MDHQDARPMFDAAYFRELAAKYEAADHHEIAAKLTEVATEFGSGFPARATKAPPMRREQARRV